MGHLIIERQDVERPAAVSSAPPNMDMIKGLLSFVHGIGWAEEQGRRPEMEDGMVVIKGWGGQRGAWLIGVYDGHGGRQTVDFLLKHLHINIWREVYIRGCKRRAEMEAAVSPQKCDAVLSELSAISLCTDVDIEQALSAAFTATDLYVRKANILESGSTACVCVIRPHLRVIANTFQSESGAPGDGQSTEKDTPTHTSLSLQAHVAHLGDTRALLVMTDGTYKRLTHSSDHKASDEREVERVEELGGWVMGERVNGMLAIGRAFGDWNLKLVCPPEASVKAGQAQRMIVSNVPDVCTHILSEVKAPRQTSEKDSIFVADANINSGVNFTHNNVCTSSWESSDGVAQPALILLGCDGLFDVCTDETVAGFCLSYLGAVATEHSELSTSEAAELLCRGLVEEAVVYRGSGDNVSIVAGLFTPLKSFERYAVSKTQGTSLRTTGGDYLERKDYFCKENPQKLNANETSSYLAFGESSSDYIGASNSEIANNSLGNTLKSEYVGGNISAGSSNFVGENILTNGQIPMWASSGGADVNAAKSCLLKPAQSIGHANVYISARNSENLQTSIMGHLTPTSTQIHYAIPTTLSLPTGIVPRYDPITTGVRSGPLTLNGYCAPED